MKIALCDDEEIFCLRMEKIIREYLNSMNLCYELEIFNSGEQLVSDKNKLTDYDIFYLDVDMGDLSGIETAKIIREYTKNAYIIFVTAHIQYSLNGYYVDAIRYILKDYVSLKAAVEESLDAVLAKMNTTPKRYHFEFVEEPKELSINEIIFIESVLHKLVFHLKKGKTYTLYRKLDEIEKKLLNTNMCRIHKSYLVNIAYITNIERYMAYLKDGTSVSISKSKYMDVKKKYISEKGRF